MMNVRHWSCRYSQCGEPVDNPATPDVDLDDPDPDDLLEAVPEDEDPDPEDSSEALPEGPAPEDEDWSEVDEDPGTALVDDTHPTAD